MMVYNSRATSARNAAQRPARNGYQAASGGAARRKTISRGIHRECKRIVPFERDEVPFHSPPIGLNHGP
jgi:hypothetical protein